MSFDAPSAAFSGRVVDHEPLLDVQASGMSERTKLPVSKYVPSRCALHFPGVPTNHDIAICLLPPQTIVEEAQGGWNGAVMAYVVTVMDVYEDPAFGRHQTCKLAENLEAASVGKDVSEDIPEARDDIKSRLDQLQFFGAHSADLGVRTMHPNTWLYQQQFRNVTGLCDPAGSPAVAGSHI
jgi:hypothetical protein